MENNNWINVKISIGGTEIKGVKSIGFVKNISEKEYKKYSGKNHHRKFTKAKKYNANIFFDIKKFAHNQ